MKKFKSTFQSLTEFECPEWFKDCKFGIWSHWGPQSVPMCGDWYARYMYLQGSPQNLYHVRHYGHPSEFGYKDICALWKAEKFDPDELMELYYKAGARYFVAQAMHHDNFFNYESEVNPCNSMQIGPHKDICSMWKAAAKKYNMPFGLTEHLGASYYWWKTNKMSDTYGPYKGVKYDGSDKKYESYYYDNYDPGFSPEIDMDLWYTTNKNFHEYWYRSMIELIDKFEPDLLYSDGGLPFAISNSAELSDENYKRGLDIVAYLYNKSIEKYGSNKAVYTQKDRRSQVYNIGVLDIEKSQLPGVMTAPWQTDTCIGNWFYDAQQAYKKPAQIIEMLVDIVSKNGNMLLNILQKPDGTIDAEARYILEELAKWFEICGEAIHGTRTWKTSIEGETRVHIDGFREDKTEWSASDYRFTEKNGKVYAFMLKAPENRVAVLKSFMDEKIIGVKLMGGKKLKFSHEFGILTVQLPDKLPTEYTNCLEIEFA